jgi:hypothetical protein
MGLKKCIFGFVFLGCALPLIAGQELVPDSCPEIIVSLAIPRYGHPLMHDPVGVLQNPKVFETRDQFLSFTVQALPRPFQLKRGKSLEIKEFSMVMGGELFQARVELWSESKWIGALTFDRMGHWTGSELSAHAKLTEIFEDANSVFSVLSESSADSKLQLTHPATDFLSRWAKISEKNLKFSKVQSLGRFKLIHIHKKYSSGYAWPQTVEAQVLVDSDSYSRKNRGPLKEFLDDFVGLHPLSQASEVRAPLTEGGLVRREDAWYARPRSTELPEETELIFTDPLSGYRYFLVERVAEDNQFVGLMIYEEADSFVLPFKPELKTHSYPLIQKIGQTTGFYRGGFQNDFLQWTPPEGSYSYRLSSDVRSILLSILRSRYQSPWVVGDHRVSREFSRDVSEMEDHLPETSRYLGTDAGGQYRFYVDFGPPERSGVKPFELYVLSPSIRYSFPTGEASVVQSVALMAYGTFRTKPSQSKTDVLLIWQRHHEKAVSEWEPLVQALLRAKADSIVGSP